MQGQLFTTDFLLRGIADTPAWAALDDAALARLRADLAALFAPFGADSALNEAQTEQTLVEPVLALLGWGDAWISQVNLSVTGREDVPDYLLFAEPAARERAWQLADHERPRLGVALLEAKRWLRALDRGDETGGANRKRRDFGAPSSQMLRYLSRADVMSDRAIQWGILTNGALWRLYWQDARSRAEEFFELDLAGLLGVPGLTPALDAISPAHGLRLFWLLFGRAGFNPQAWDGEGRTLHRIALAEARRYEETVSDQLGQRVFSEVFPRLCAALAAGDPERALAAAPAPDQGPAAGGGDLAEVREAALILLYRLLFLCYAEDRRLLPVLDPRYAPYSLAALRDAVAAAQDGGVVLSARATRWWDGLTVLFRLISDGDDQVGLPAYNGGLFAPERSRLLGRTRVPDATLGPVIDALSRRVEDITRPRINYRDLSVAHLGGIYERLLEYRLEAAADGLPAGPPASVNAAPPAGLTVVKAGFARKGSGSYYTHDALVRLLLDETVGRLVAERQQAFDDLLARLHGRASLNPPDWDALAHV